MNIVICITIIAITGILLMKRYQPQPVLIGMGVLMMFIAYEANWIDAILVESQSTGVLVFDAMDIVRITTSENIVNLGPHDYDLCWLCKIYGTYWGRDEIGTYIYTSFISSKSPIYCTGPNVSS